MLPSLGFPWAVRRAPDAARGAASLCQIPDPILRSVRQGEKSALSGVPVIVSEFALAMNSHNVVWLARPSQICLQRHGREEGVVNT